MRVLRIGGAVSLGISPSQEAAWPDLAAAAIEAVREGLYPVPVVWFKTDTGSFGSIPVHTHVAIGFVDDDEPAGFLGAVTQMGPGRNPQDQ
ncbi:hypothetical protein EDF52_12010 [Curtobacterium sp. PhB42]|nr:hypothetical protein EDF52_12010 [Curtobacterium sp. PhB42]TDW50791.1 hypothetical protein EDF47_11510 [Curtobacterium sp. PhB190]